MSKENQAMQTEIVPQHEHKRKLIAETEERKKNNPVIQTFIKVMPDNHKKGGKVRLLKRMKNGNVHSLYLGRYHQVTDLLAKFKEKGIKIIS